MSGDLAGWLLTQISEDERLIHVWDVRAVLWPEEGHDPGECDECDHRRQHRAGDDRLTDRLLAECAAKRAIIELHQHDGPCWEMHRGVYPADTPSFYAEAGSTWAHPSLEGQDVHPGPCETLQLLAAPFSDRPGFRPEWQVTP